MKLRNFVFCLLILVSTIANAQKWIEILDNRLILDNGYIQREVDLQGDSLIGTLLMLRGDKSNFIQESREFAFILNDKQVDGFSGWELIAINPIESEYGGHGAKVRVKSKNFAGLDVEINYVMYPDLPLIRKWLMIHNDGDEEIKIENLNIEDLHSNLDFVHSIVLHNYARMKHLGRFVGDWHDPVVVVNNQRQSRGMALGNEAIGVLKRTGYHTEGFHNNIQIGLSHTGQEFPFRKWISPGDSFSTPKTFLCLYTNRYDGFEVINEEVNTFVIKHMKPRIIQLDEKPTFVYNTWNPFRTFVSDTLIQEVAMAAAECGLQEFIVDDGWQ